MIPKPTSTDPNDILNEIKKISDELQDIANDVKKKRSYEVRSKSNEVKHVSEESKEKVSPEINTVSAQAREIIQAHRKCTCKSKRHHIFTLRVTTFCCCFERVSWYHGLCIIGFLTIFFGITITALFYAVALRAKPAAIDSQTLFPFFSDLVTCQLFFFIILGTMLLFGVYYGNLESIKCFPWLLLGGYIFAGLITFKAATDGEKIVHALVWSDNGMLIKTKRKKEEEAVKRQRIIFFIVIVLLIIALIAFISYIIILSLTWIEKLEHEIEDELI